MIIIVKKLKIIFNTLKSFLKIIFKYVISDIHVISLSE